VDIRASTPEPVPAGASGETAETREIPESVTWRVDKRLTVGKWAGAVIFALAAVLGFPDPGQVIVVGIAALLLAVLAVRDLAAPVRLAADPAGVTVSTGFAGRRSIAWAEVAKIKVDARKGVFLRSQVLELDVNDNLYFFSVNELSTPCDEVADQLMAMRARSAR
jgi:hypothetical protein